MVEKNKNNKMLKKNIGGSRDTPVHHDTIIIIIIIIIMRGDRTAAGVIWSGKSCPLGSAAFSSVDAVDMISFDFQQNLPTLTCNIVMYSMHVNFGIYDCAADKTKT